MKLICTLFLLTICFHTFSQENLGYQTPHPDILQLADVDLPPSVILNEAKDMAVFLSRDQYKSLENLSEPELRLAGLRINPKTNIGSRTRFFKRAALYDMEKQKEITIKGLPSSVKLSNFSWSPSQDHFAVTNTVDNGVELWIVEVKKAKASKLTEATLNANMGRPFEWVNNSDLLVRMLPTDRKPLIEENEAIPSGPTISTNDGAKAQNRTYQDLLKNKADEDNFEQLSRSSVWHIKLNGEKSEWLPTGMYRSINASPNGEYVMVQEVKKPFSYLVPYRRFPYTTTVYYASGVEVKVVNNVPLDEERPQGFMSTRLGKRNMAWRADKPAMLYYVQALDEGDPELEVPFRDEVFILNAPFSAAPKSLGKTKLRFGGIDWGDDDTAVAYDYWWNTRTLRTTLFDPSAAIQTGSLLSERNYQDRYNDPGEFVNKRNEFGQNVLAEYDGKLFLLGDGYSEDGILPFFDEFNQQSLETKRLWRAEKGNTLEEVVDVVDFKDAVLLERIESPSDYPNYFLRDVGSVKKPKQVTHFENPFAAMKNVHKEVISYKREDGLDLSATLYLPADYDKNSGEKLPMLMWAYPREFKDKGAASQITNSPNEFTYPYYGSPIFWVNRGYAVLDDAAFPIIGEGEEEPNDSFIPQLVANAKAAIDAVDDLGYIDRARVGVGGHSYGAFMTANLLTHSDLFAAGIARSGAYNRSLTPFGFQSEERNFWEASDIYFQMSPFMNAEKMKHPLLLIHGEADNNSGTYPMQSERYFNALKGLGATVRLVMLPKESHGYAARENIMHLLWEQDQWLEKYVKNKKSREN